MTQYSAKKPAARQTLQNTIVPAIGWILSANEIKLVTPAIISETRHTVISTARTTIIFLALEFWAGVAAAFTICCRYCAPECAASHHLFRISSLPRGTFCRTTFRGARGSGRGFSAYLRGALHACH